MRALACTGVSLIAFMLISQGSLFREVSNSQSVGAGTEPCIIDDTYKLDHVSPAPNTSSTLKDTAENMENAESTEMSNPIKPTTEMPKPLPPTTEMPNPVQLTPELPTPVDPEGTDCTAILELFKSDKIPAAKNTGDKNYRQSFVALSKTSKPFYFASHHPNIDSARSSLFSSQMYYEHELTKRVTEIFQEKAANNQSAVLLDVGGNIGWYSLLAAAYGASKVYSFEPNLVNTVRFCEALSMNRWLHDDRGKDVVIPITKGAGDSERRQKMYKVDRTNPGSFSFDNLYTDKEVVGEFEITTLDLFAERHGWFESKPLIALFKLDVESYELHVLKGAKKLLKSGLIEKIAMELKYDQDKQVTAEIVHLLFDSGYELYMHGGVSGPNTKVQKSYKTWNQLSKDFVNEIIGENVIFRFRSTYRDDKIDDLLKKLKLGKLF